MMEENLREISNDELLNLYRLIVEHMEFLQVELNKVVEEGKDKNEWGTNK